MKRITIITLIALTIVSGYVAWLKLPLWRDTIFISENNGTLIFPSGDEIPTNRWFNSDSYSQFSLLIKEKSKNYNLIEEYDSTSIIMLKIGRDIRPALITDYQGKGPNYQVRFSVKQEYKPLR